MSPGGVHDVRKYALKWQVPFTGLRLLIHQPKVKNILSNAKLFERHHELHHAVAHFGDEIHIVWAPIAMKAFFTFLHPQNTCSVESIT